MQNQDTTCPACKRKYEVPVRPQLRADDWEFSATPRLLPCLHSCCQSCLIELQQDRGAQEMEVMCPTCDEMQPLPRLGPSALPFDSLCMQVILKRDQTLYVEHCHRCQDEVPSIAWCLQCRSALCSFHTKDHRMSLHTSEHEVATFRTLERQGLDLVPNLPRYLGPRAYFYLSTPDGEAPIASYCLQCAHIVGVGESVDVHLEHQQQVVECSPMETQRQLEAIRETVALCTPQAHKIEAALLSINQKRNSVRDNHELTASDIQHVFNSLRKAIDRRETELVASLEQETEDKLAALTKQHEYYERDQKAVQHTLQYANNAMKRLQGEHLMAMANSIRKRAEELVQQVEADPLAPLEDDKLRFSYVHDNFERFQRDIRTFGAVHTSNTEPAASARQEVTDEQPINKPTVTFNVVSRLPLTRVTTRPYTVLDSRKQDTTIAEVHHELDHPSPNTQLARVAITTITEPELNNMCEVATTFDMYHTGGGVPELRITKRLSWRKNRLSEAP